MKFLSESNALMRLEKIKSEYRSVIKNEYEPKAKSCLTCETRGACCVDEHFVNVHISRLEAAAILEKLKKFTTEKQRKIYARIRDAVKKYNLTDAEDSFAKTFACPLYEKGAGCLVHSVKPVPCIQHACYDRQTDLPPDELQTVTEAKIESLNRQTYGQNTAWLPLPTGLLNLIKNKIR